MKTFSVKIIGCRIVNVSKVCNREQMNWLNRQGGQKCLTSRVFLPLCYCIEFYLDVIYVSDVKSICSQHSVCDFTPPLDCWPWRFTKSSFLSLQVFDKGLLSSRSQLSCQKSFNSGLLECHSSMSLRVFLSSHLYKCNYFATQCGKLYWTNHLNSARVRLRHGLEIFLLIWVVVCLRNLAKLSPLKSFNF